MTITPLSPFPITAFVRRRYLTGTGHASPTATLSAASGRQNLPQPIPDHQADRTRAAKTSAPLVAQPSSCLEPTNQINQRR
jgi:hypothetical protein